VNDGSATPLPVPPLEGEGFQLRALTVADAPELYAQVVDDAEIRRWSSIGRVTDLSSTERWAAARSTPERVEWTIRLPDGSVAGRIALHRVAPADGIAEIGYGLFSAHRGRGLARRAVNRVTAYGFGDLGLRRIELEHAVDNTRSCAVAAACGYALEGTRRQALEDHLGGWEDSHLHARLSSD
jgi:ribosomal-protein-alanine N-acetyltransferase